MRKPIGYFTTLFLMLTLTSCAINRLNDEKSVIMLEKKREGGIPVQISVEKGPHWTHKITPGPFVIHILPQIVFWTEDTAGGFLETLYITGADGNYTRHATKGKMDSAYFRACFPVWADRAMRAGQSLPSSAQPYTDAVTSATPQSSFDLQFRMKKSDEPFVLMAEINQSSDYNEVFTEQLTDWTGQPSVVYAVRVDSVQKEPFLLKARGRGGLPSEPAVFVEDLEGVDTALQIIDQIRFVFR